MTDEKTWKLSEMRTLFRELTGRKTTSQISDEDANKEINDYWVNHFPSDAKVDRFDVFFTQALSATDTGVYPLSSNIDRLDDPVTINGRQIILFREREVFFETHDYYYGHNHFLRGNFTVTSSHLGIQFKDEQFITDPTLAIGTTNATRVKHAAFDYRIGDFSFSKATSEVALTGGDIPQGKYGAWSLKIDDNGDITVASATDNATGYDTPRKALDALDSSDSESAYMGYVTATKSDGVFTPDTTLLNATNVTATFTDGKFENRGEPLATLLYGSNLYVKPKPNDIYELEGLSISNRPAAFADDDAVPNDARWGPVIAAKAAAIFLKRNEESAADAIDVVNEYMSSIRSDKIRRLLGQQSQRSF